MAENSGIEWTEATWNPVSGCTHASAGCDHCYAVTMTHRLEAMGQAKYAGLTVLNGRGHRHFNGQVRCDEAALKIPLGWKKPKRVFVNSMSDLFHRDVPFEFVDKVFAVMALCPQHTFQILTKRPERMAEYLTWRSGSHELDADRRYVVWSACRLLIEAAVKTGTIRRLFATPDETKLFLKEFEWPLPNVWLGCSVENQDAADRRIPELLKTPAAVRFLSVEPLLGPVDFFNADRDGLRGGMRGAIHWIIVGGESGPNARPCDVEWIRNIVRQCKEAGVPCFVKQLGSRPTVDLAGSNDGFGEGTVAIPDGLVGTGDDVVLRGKVALRDRKGGDMAEFPEDLRVREFPRSFSHG